MKSFLKLAHFIFIIICVVIQIAFIEHLRIFYINIDLILITVIAVSIFDGGIYGMLYGFFAGLVLDLMIGKIIGVNALIYSINGFLAYRIVETGLKRKTLNYILLVLFFTEMNILLYWGIYFLFSFEASYAKLGFEMLINPLCNIAVMFLVFPLINAGNVKKEEIGFVYKDKI